jgi:hypothetical protein
MITIVVREGARMWPLQWNLMNPRKPNSIRGDLAYPTLRKIMETLEAFGTPAAHLLKESQSHEGLNG